MFILGLTGGIGMGKSETARLFRRLGVPVHDADAAVHTLYADGGAAVATVGEAFPGSVVGGAVERGKLALWSRAWRIGAAQSLCTRWFSWPNSSIRGRSAHADRGARVPFAV